MSFQFSPSTNPDKGFLIRQSELEERLDPLFYVAVRNLKKHVEERAKYRFDSLIKLCSINRGRFGHRPRNDPAFYDGEYPFIQTGDIVQVSEGNQPIKYTQTLNEKGLKTSKLFKPPKLLFTIAANIADTAILNYPSCFPDSVVALTPKNNKISIEYLNIYLRLIKPFIVELAPYSAQRNLNNQQLAQVPIIAPPKEIQFQIISRMNSAYEAKQQKEIKSQKLLNSIDDYLLNELGIKKPQAEKKSIEDRIFKRQISELSSGRFDPSYFKHSYKHLELLVEQSHFPRKLLKDVAAAIISGSTPASSEYSDTETPYPIIKAGSYSGDNIELKKVGFTKNKRVKFAEKNDIYILSAAHQADYVGRSIKHLENKPKENTSFVGELICIRTNSDICNSTFLFSLLNTFFYKDLLNREKTGQTSHIYPSDIKNIKIPLPDLDKQNQIAKHIITIHQQAKALNELAARDLEIAKQEIENMILE